nr:MAG TPA: hypothetical protein [Caudoviricetes sp.]
MTYRPLREASDGVINGAAFRQCYTVCCTCGPLKVYGQDTKSRTRCQFLFILFLEQELLRHSQGMFLAFPARCAIV